MILLKGSKNYYSIIIIILQWIDLWICSGSVCFLRASAHREAIFNGRMPVTVKVSELLRYRYKTLQFNGPVS